MKTTATKLILSSLLTLLLTGCGGGSGGGNNGGGGSTPSPTASLTASATTIVVGQSVTLTPTTTNATSCTITGVTTPVTCNVPVTVTPTATITYTLTATGAGGSATSSAPVTVNPVVIPVVVTLTPQNVASLNSGAQQQFTATVTGSSNTSVTFAVTPASAGTITGAGLFTAANVAGTNPLSVTIKATSAADPTQSAPSTVTVNPVTVSVACNPLAITTAPGSTSNCSATVTGAANGAVTWSASLGSINGGVFSSNVAGTATITATSAQDPTKSGTKTVTVTAVPAIAAACVPNAITTADSSQCTATYQNLGSGVNWSATGTGTAITAAGVFTTTAAGTFTITATSTQVGYTTVSGSTTVTVTAAVPVITGSNAPYIYCDAECGIVGFPLNGSGFEGTDTISCSPSGILQSTYLLSSKQLEILLGIDPPHTSPGYVACTVTSPDGTHSTSWSVPFLGGQNPSGLSPVGELFFSDEAQGAAPGQNGYIRKYKADGTSDGSFLLPSLTAAIDDLTGNLLANGGDYDENGDPSHVTGPASPPSGRVIAEAAKHAYGCFLQPLSNNNLSCYPLTGGGGLAPIQTAKDLGVQPISLDMGVLGTETDAFVLSRNATPTLWKINVSGGTVVTLSQSIPGITPYTTLYANNPIVGGWHVGVFDSGPAAGTVAVLSTADNLLTFLNTSTMAITKQVTLPGIPFRIAVDKTNGKLIVAFVDQTNVRTSFAAVDPTTGASTTLTSVTPAGLLAVGLQVSADGKSIYACQRTQCVVLANQ